MMASSFTGAQFLTAMMWGRVSDSEKGGRKLVLLVGLFGTSKNNNNLGQYGHSNRNYRHFMSGIWLC